MGMARTASPISKATAGISSPTGSRDTSSPSKSGISPTNSRIGSSNRRARSRISSSVQGMEDIKKGLNEKEYGSGAYYLSYPSFVDSYRVIRRMTERNGQSVYLMVVSICDAKGNPIETKERIEQLAEGLKTAIGKSLRRSDLFSLYSPTQFVILLNGAKEEDCDMIFNRINQNFGKDHKSWKKCLKYHIASAVELKANERIKKFTLSKTWD